MNDIREDLKAYIDGELPEARAREVEAAIASDPALQQEVHFMRMLGFEIKKATHEAPIKGAAETIAKIRKPKSGLLRLPLIPVAFTALAVMGVSMVIYPMFAGFNDSEMEIVSFRQDSGAASAAPSTSSEAAVEVQNQLQERSYAKTTKSLPLEGGDSLEEDKKSSEMTFGSSNGSPETERGLRSGGGLYMDSKGRKIDRDRNRTATTTTPSEAHKVFKQPKLIRNADVSVKVESVHDAQDKISEIAKKLNGFLSNTALNVQADKTAEATTVFRVPVENFEAALIEIRNMGEVLSESSKSDDVTAEVADKESRIVSLADQEKNLIAELSKTKDANLKFQIRSRLDNVRVELTSIKAQYKALRDVADYSTINLRFVGRPQGESARTGANWSDDTWTNATSSSKNVGRFFGAIGMYLLAYAPFWIPVLFVGWLIARRRAA